MDDTTLRETATAEALALLDRLADPTRNFQAAMRAAYVAVTALSTRGARQPSRERLRDVASALRSGVRAADALPGAINALRRLVAVAGGLDPDDDEAGNPGGGLDIDGSWSPDR